MEGKKERAGIMIKLGFDQYAESVEKLDAPQKLIVTAKKCKRLLLGQKEKEKKRLRRLR